MTILTSQGSGGGFLYGLIEDVFSPTVGDNISALDIISLVNADISATINSSLYANWSIQWTLQIFCGSFYSPPQRYQSPIDSTDAYILEFIGGSTQTAKQFGNHISQSSPVFNTWGNSGSSSYPGFAYLPSSPNPCSFIYFLPTGSAYADSVSILAQSAPLADMIYRLIYAAIGNADTNGYYANMPNPGSEYV